MTFSNGDCYKGDWIDGEKEGRGVYEFSSGDIYEGSWAKDKRNGRGTYKVQLILITIIN